MMRFHHLGVACKSIEETLSFIAKTLTIVRRTEIIHDRTQDVYACMVSVQEGPQIELLSGPAVETIVKKNIALYHLCYEVDDLDGVVRRFCDSGALLMTEPREGIFFNGRRFAFVSTPVGITEFIEAEQASHD